MNVRTEDLTSEILRERVKVGASLADVDPMHLDASVSFCLFFFKTAQYSVIVFLWHNWIMYDHFKDQNG